MPSQRILIGLAGVALIVVATAAYLLWPRSEWSQDEIATLRGLWIGSLPALPPDPSNKVADDERAVALGPAAVLRHSAQRQRQGRLRLVPPARTGLPGRQAARPGRRHDRAAHHADCRHGLQPVAVLGWPQGQPVGPGAWPAGEPGRTRRHAAPSTRT